MSKVDTEGGESFCSSPKLFQDRTSWYKCRICIGSSALTSFLIIIIAQWDIVWSKWGEKFKRGKGVCTCSKRGAKEKNVGMPRVEIVSEVNSVRGKLYFVWKWKGVFYILGFWSDFSCWSSMYLRHIWFRLEFFSWDFFKAKMGTVGRIFLPRISGFLRHVP